MSFTRVRQVVRRSRKIEFTWRYLFNVRSAVSYKLRGSPVSGEASRVLRDVNRDGIAITTSDRLLGKPNMFSELSTEVDVMENNLTGRLQTARQQAYQADIGQKTFMVELLGKYPKFDINSIYARFALQKPIVDIANAYFGMFTRLRYYNVWHTLSTTAEARESQLWHRDREDFFILKLFVYMGDVGESAGPFIYAPGTHPKGSIQSDAQCFVENGVKRSTDEQVAGVVPPKRWITAAGSKGTIVFADTRGYHKGGLARTNDRVMYTCMFTSPASESPDFFDRRT